MEYIGIQLNTAECNSSVIYWSSMIVADSEDVAVPVDSADSGDSPDYTAPVAHSGVPWNTSESN